LEKAILNLISDDAGATLSEYGLLLVLIMLVCYSGVLFFGVKTSEMFDFS
jgi:Flp pilus assembly pilin Flp